MDACPAGTACITLGTDLGTFQSTGQGGELDFGGCPTPGNRIRVSTLTPVAMTDGLGVDFTLVLPAGTLCQVDAASQPPNCP
ncbi:MAG: hypothetical protein RBU45_21415 [Myxococcota bacterium]|jgi:hypothetical protein|nr:hypothetical protein [Myxococcota bacterium]